MKSQVHHQNPKSTWVAISLPSVALVLTTLMHGLLAAAIALSGGGVLLLLVVILAMYQRIKDRSH